MEYLRLKRASNSIDSPVIQLFFKYSDFEYFDSVIFNDNALTDSWACVNWRNETKDFSPSLAVTVCPQCWQLCWQFGQCSSPHAKYYNFDWFTAVEKWKSKSVEGSSHCEICPTDPAGLSKYWPVHIFRRKCFQTLISRGFFSI